MKIPTTTVSTRIPVELADWFKQMASNQGRSPSVVLQMLIENLRRRVLEEDER